MNAQISCPSKILQVTVHARGALVRRQVVVPDALPAGDCELLIDITPLAEPGSVRAAAPSGGRPIIAVQSAVLIPAIAIPVGPSEALVQKLQALLGRLGLTIERLQAQRQSLAALQPDPGLRTTSMVDKIDERMAETLATAQLLGTVQADVDRRLHELEIERIKTHRELEAALLLQAQASTELHPGSARQQRRVTVRLGGGGELSQLEVVYVVPAARFWPVYTLRITDGGRKATWLIEALCAQRSGEDWRDVQLALSTADLIYDARLPELPSLRLGRAQPPTRRGYRPPPDGLERMFAGYDRAFGPALLPPAGAPRDADDAELGLYEDESASYEKESGEEGGLPAAYQPPSPKGHAGGPSPAKRELAQDLPSKKLSPPVVGSSSRSRSLGAAPSLAPPPASPGGYGGRPGMPPQSQSATAMGRGEMAKTATPLMLSRGGGGGGFGGALGGGDYSDDDGGAAGPEPDRAGSEPQDAWLDFDHLLMAGAAEPQRRGRLTYSGESDSGQRQQALAQLEFLTPSDLVSDPQSSRGRFDHRYEADGIVVIPTDGQPHRVALLCAETTPELRMLTVPRERPEVYREAELQNPCEAPLLSGPVDVYVEGSLLTTARIDHIDRGGTLRVGMGVEDRLRVARNVRSEEDTAGLLGGSMVVTHTVTIELSSALGQPSSVEVLERLPVSDDKSMLVEFITSRPESSPYSQFERGAPIRGGLQWRVPVAAAGKTKIEYQYRITFPAKTEIVGGNRRD